MRCYLCRKYSLNLDPFITSRGPRAFRIFCSWCFVRSLHLHEYSGGIPHAACLHAPRLVLWHFGLRYLCASCPKPTAQKWHNCCPWTQQPYRGKLERVRDCTQFWQTFSRLQGASAKIKGVPCRILCVDVWTVINAYLAA